jgi:ABC-type lipoprotein release transport system permease subunit
MSIDLKMAWRNVWRNPRRSILTIAAVMFASLLLVFMLSFQFGAYEAMINTSVKINTGHLQVQAKGYLDKKSMRLVVSHPERVGGILEKIPGIEAFTYRANAFSLVSSNERTHGVLVVGVDPDKEMRVSTIKKLIRSGSYLTTEDSNLALVGSLLARNLRVKTGDELTLLGQGRDGSIAATVVKIKGIFSSGIDAFDRSAIQIPLKDFQQIYAMRDGVHEVVIVGSSLTRVAEIKKAVVKGLENTESRFAMKVLDWMEIMPGLLQSIQLDLISGLIMYLMLIIVVAFSILNTFLMVIFERTREFGVLMAIGTTPGRLTKLVLTESMILTLIGIVLGIIIGCVITLIFQSYGIEIAGASEMLGQFGISGRMYPKLSLLSALSGPLLVLLITLLAALYPSLKVRRLKPVEAMTYI